MKKSALLLLLATSAVSLFGAQAWIGSVQNTSTSTHLTKINDANAKGDQVLLQFNGAGTLTVDTSVSVETVVFGSGSTNVSPAYVQINEGQTLSVNSMGTNVGRPASNITFQGDGTFVVRGQWITFEKSGSGDGEPQYYAFNQKGALDITSKIITVKNNNFVEMNYAKMASATGATLNMSGISSLVVKNVGKEQLHFKNSTISDEAYWSFQSATAMVSGTTVFNDGTTFDFLNATGNAVLPSLAVSGNLTLNNVQVSQMATQVFVEDGATFTSNASEASVYVKQFIIKKGTLQLNTTNAFYGEPNNAPKISIARAGAKIILGADNDFGDMNIYKSGDNPAGTLFFTLGGNNASFNKIKIEDTNAMMYITDFMEGLLFVNSELAKNEDDSLLNIFSVELDEVGNILSQTKLYQNESGYITAIQVPEPAEWALIFGAIALGFIAYRRRK